MREEYEAWFIGKFGYPPMPIHSRVLDFCWQGYQAGIKANESEVAQLRQQLDAKDPFVPDAFDGNDICDAWAGLPVEFFNPGPNFGCLK